MKQLPPKWKTVDCPTCESKAGGSCGEIKRGASYWIRVAPHVARKRLAEQSVAPHGALKEE